MVPERVGKRIVLGKKGSKLIAQLVMGKPVDDFVGDDPRVMEPKPERQVVEAQAAGE